LALTGRIKPPNQGLTEEAKQALNLETDPEIFAEDYDDDIVDPSYVASASTGLPLFDETGDFIDDESRLKQKPLPTPPPRDASKGIPALDEWVDFFARIFLRVVCDWYISFAFRGIDEDALTDREIDRLQLSDEERKRIAVPLSELSYKSKLMRKHGRTIIASGGAFDALITLGTWASRVNRIASRHKPKVVKGQMYERTGPDAQAGDAAGANGGKVGAEWTIYNPGG
jgi:hypothetical protein